jgi:hypothetical protein
MNTLFLDYCYRSTFLWSLLRSSHGSSNANPMFLSNRLPEHSSDLRSLLPLHAAVARSEGQGRSTLDMREIHQVDNACS